MTVKEFKELLNELDEESALFFIDSNSPTKVYKPLKNVFDDPFTNVVEIQIKSI